MTSLMVDSPEAFQLSTSVPLRWAEAPAYWLADVELRHLRYFVTVVEALNFTEAATCLRVAQPALGRQVSNFEEELGR
jgi:hypothetical protein